MLLVILCLLKKLLRALNGKRQWNWKSKSLRKNETWELTTLPAGTKKIGVKWIFKTKLNENRKVNKHKTRLVAKGYS